MGVQLNKCFKDANESRKRYKILLGSAGSGKSVNVATDYIIKLSDPQYYGANLLCIRASEHSHSQSTFSELAKAIYKLNLQDVWDIRQSSLIMQNRYTGASIYFRGCNDQRALERLKSITARQGYLCWVWIEEATELRQSDLEVINDRLRGELPEPLFYQITMTFNPINANHWLKTAYWDSTDANIYRCKTTYKQNAFIDKDYDTRMERRKIDDPIGYKVYALGEWGESEGLVFANWSIGNYEAKDFDNLYEGTDFGFNHAHATLLIAFKDNDIYILKEVYRTGATKGEIIKALSQHSIPKDKIMFCDSAEPASIKELRQAGYQAHPVEKEANSVKAQIAWLKDRHIYIDGRCINTIKEMQKYRYIKDKITGLYTDEPLSIDDDAISALRYAIEAVRKGQKLQTIKKGGLF